jgi:hypothetical protein
MDVDASDQIAFGSGIGARIHSDACSGDDGVAERNWIFECLSYSLWAVLMTLPDLTIQRSSGTRNPHRGSVGERFQ